MHSRKSKEVRKVEQGGGGQVTEARGKPQSHSQNLCFTLSEMGRGNLREFPEAAKVGKAVGEPAVTRRLTPMLSQEHK